MKAKLLAFVSFFVLSFSDSYSGTINEKKGFRITPNSSSQNNLISRSGEDFNFEGNICVVRWSGFGSEKCLKVPTSKPVFKAYFPDSLHDVSDKLVISQGHDKKSWTYRFRAENLKSTDLNQLTITVGASSKKAEDLLKIKAKLEKRVLILKNFSAEYAGKSHYHRNYRYINELITYLELLISRIDVALENNPEILAQLRHPIQMENRLASPMFYSSNFSGHKITLKLPVGVAFEGEKAQIEASVTNLSDKSFYFPGFEDEDGEDDVVQSSAGNQTYKMTIELDGQNLLQSTTFQLGFGATKTFTVNSGKLNPSLANKIKIHLEKSYNGHFDFSDFFNRRLGSLSYDMGVIEDEVAPQIKNVLPLPGSYHKIAPAISAEFEDLKGRIEAPSIQVIIRGTTAANEVINKDITSFFTITNEGQGNKYIVSGNAADLVEGIYELEFRAKDYAGNLVSKTVQNIVFDKTMPVINIYTSDNVLTNNPAFDISATAFDNNPGITRIKQNGSVVFSTSTVIADYTAQLVEGINNFEIESVDAAGNIATKRGLYNVVLDTVAPVLSELIPSNNSNLYALTFSSSGKSNEPLMSVKINNLSANLSSDSKSFSKSLTAYLEGGYPIEIVATDKAQNTTTLNINVNIVLKVLNKDLIAITPHPENADKLIVTGAPGATKPGAEVRLYSGLFNQKTFISNASDGSFEVVMDFFNSVEVRAKDLILNRTEVGNLSYNVDTTLAGVIKDTDNRPLSGVRVTILSSGQYAVTDATGSFRIPTPATGDQVLNLDGATIPLIVSGPNRKFAKVNIAVSIGTRQLNILDKPIYLAPLMFDGTETIIADENSSVVVESPHAPGVSLRIPAGVATFPDSRKNGTIGVAEINAEYTAVPVLDFAKPQTVYAFEPSGLKFSEPVELTLPNVNEIPPGVQMVIMSKNSIKGIWEIDGLARVSEDGSEIITEEGAGITHFSEIYAVPLGPKVTELGGNSHPGADTAMGVLKNSIDLPSYKMFGKDMAFGLSYQSNWADPTVVISNVLDVPKNEYTFSNSAGARTLLAKASVNISGKAWVEPEKVSAKFYTGSLESTLFNYTGIPSKSVISYAMDLNTLSSGVHTYNSHYDIELKQLIVGTRTTKIKKLFGKTRTTQESFSETRDIEEIFPQDLGGSIYVQNYKNSPAGQGWRINGAGKIHNIDEPRILIEEASGETTSYAVNSNIQTIYSGGSSQSLAATDLSRWPEVGLYSSNDKVYSKYSFGNGSLTPVTTVNSYSGKFEGVSYSIYTSADYSNPPNTHQCSVFCSIEYALFDKPREINNIFSFDNYSFILSNEGNLDVFNGYALLKKSGKYYQPRSDYSWRFGVDPWPVSYCSNHVGTQCYGLNTTARRGTLPSVFYSTESFLPEYDCPYVTSKAFDGLSSACTSNGYLPQSTGDLPVTGFQDGNDPHYNSLYSAIKGFGDEVIVADFGNNRVRALNVQTNVVRTLAGNGQTSDVGDGGAGVNASLYHPRGLAKDTLGNIYISTENGFIRKLDPNGFISTFAGKTNGVLKDKSQAQEMRLNNPYGMTVDTANNYLYVADTGHHRVVRIDLSTREAITVAGSGACQAGNIGDGKAALFASLCSPTTLGLDDHNNLLIFDKGHNRIRRVNFENGNGGAIQYQAIAQDNSILVKESNGTFVRTFRNGSVLKYDTLGRQISAEDRIGNKFTNSYNTDGTLASITDPTNRTTQYIYSWGKLGKIVDPQGRETQFDYDGDQLTRVEFPDGSERSFEYGPSGLMINEFDKRGSQTNYAYNEWKRLQKVTRADNSFINFIDGISSTVGNHYIGGQTGPLKSIDKNEVIDGIRDNKGTVTTLNKDESGFVSKMTDLKGEIYTIERDLDGRPTKITRPDQSHAVFEYDPTYHDLIKKYDSSSDITLEFDYDSWGNLIGQTLPNGESVAYNYDATTGLLLNKVMPLSTTESYEYFPNGLLKAKINSLNQRASFIYGTNGNVVTITDSMGQATQLTRDSSGNILTSTNAKGQTVTYSYNSFNRLMSVKSPKNEVTSYEYFDSGELAKIIDPELNETVYEYDQLGRLKKKTDPLGLISELFYDSSDNLIKEIDPKGQVKTYEYDHLDRLTKKILPDDIYELTYDDRDNIKTVKNDHSMISYEYRHIEGGDVLAKETSKGLGLLADLPQVSLEYDYDESGNRIEMATPEGNFFYAYDKLNRLTRVTNHKNEHFDFSYDIGGRLIQQKSPVSITDYTFDNVNFLTEINHKKRSNSLLISYFNYDRDQIGNITKITSIKGDANYTYDGNNQLINATHPEAATSILTYDPLGNRVTDQDGAYLYDSNKQRLDEDWKNKYIYDNNGNLISKILKSDTTKVTSYSYNSSNQLIALKELDGSSVIKESNYFYDANGRRIVKDHRDTNVTSNSFVKKFVYDGEDILFEMDDQNNLLATYTHSKNRSDDVLSMDRAGSSYFYLKDHLGSIHEILNSSGNLVQKYVYSVFGKMLKIEDSNGQALATSHLENFYTFTGRESDFETGQLYYRSRYYDSEIGRFTSLDSDGGAMINPSSFNSKYGYCVNNPVLYRDPTGESPFKKIVGILSLIYQPVYGLVVMNTTDFFNKNFNFTGRDERRANQTATTASAAALAAVATVHGGDPASTYSFTSLYVATALAAANAELRTGNFIDNFNPIATRAYLGIALYAGFIDPGLKDAMGGVNPLEFDMIGGITPSMTVGLYMEVVSITSSLSQRKRPYQYDKTYSSQPRK